MVSPPACDELKPRGDDREILESLRKENERLKAKIAYLEGQLSEGLLQ